MLPHRILSSATLVVAISALSLHSGSSVAATPTTTAESPQESTTPPEIARSNGEDDHIKDATAEVINIQRADTGELLSVTLRITNEGTENIHDKWFGNPVYIYREDVFSGITLVDSDHGSRHHPIMDEEEYCSCSGYAPRAPYAPFVRPGESIDYWAMYSIPEEVKSVDVEIPGFDPIEDVPIG